MVVSAESWKDGPHHLYLLNRWLRDIVLIRRGKEGCFVVGKVCTQNASLASVLVQDSHPLSRPYAELFRDPQ